DFGQCRPQPGRPPGVAGPAVCRPVVQRVAPQLPGGGEVVRRHPCDKPRPPPLVEQEQLGVRPDVGRVAGHEDGHVADETQPASAARQPARPPGWPEGPDPASTPGRPAPQVAEEWAHAGSSTTSAPGTPTGWTISEVVEERACARSSTTSAPGTPTGWTISEV